MKHVSRRAGRPVRPVHDRACCNIEPLESRRLLTVTLSPISNITLPQGSSPQTLDLNQVFSDNTTGQADLKFAALSNNTSIVQTSINGNGVLTLTPAPSLSGFADVTVTATAPDKSQAVNTFRLQETASADRTLSVPLGPGHDQFQYVMANHTLATISLKGPGTGTILLGGDNLVQIGSHARGANQEVESITLTGTTAASQLVINGRAAKRGQLYPDVGNITSDGSLGSIRIKKAFLDGDVTLAGGVASINVDGARSGTMSFGQAIGAIALTVGTFTDENLSTPAPFGLIRGGNWYSTDSIPESFQAASINRVYVTGNFDAGVQLTGQGANGRSIGKLTVRGAIGGTWNIPGPTAPLVVGGTAFDWNATFASLPYINDLGNFGGTLTIPSIPWIRVHGSMQDAVLRFTAAGATDLGSLHVYNGILRSSIDAAGNLGPILAEAMQNSIVYAGVGTLPAGDALPASASDLAASATITSITLRPRKNVLAYLNSDIAAATIGNLSLGTTRIANGGSPFGVAGASISRLLVRDLTTHRVISINNVHDAATLAAQIAALGFSLQDLNIRQLS